MRCLCHHLKLIMSTEFLGHTEFSEHIEILKERYDTPYILARTDQSQKRSFIWFKRLYYHTKFDISLRRRIWNGIGGKCLKEIKHILSFAISTKIHPASFLLILMPWDRHWEI